MAGKSSGGALPLFPTQTKPTISHPILRMRRFRRAAASSALVLQKTCFEGPRTLVSGKSGRDRGNSKGARVRRHHHTISRQKDCDSSYVRHCHPATIPAFVRAILSKKWRCASKDKPQSCL